VVNIYNGVAFLFVVSIITSVLLPAQVFAAQLAARKLTLGTSAGNTATTWTFSFQPAATTALNGMTFQVCDSPSGTCNIPGGWTNAGSAFSSLTYNGSNQTGWALDNAAGFLRIKNNLSTQATASPIVATFNSVTNPNTTNASFYVRINTYTGDDYTGALDAGVVAASTSQQITLTGTMDESLVFCVGTSITGQNCGTISGNSINFGTFSPTVTSAATSVMAASSNSSSGYVITVNGSSLTCGACAGTPSIAALASQTASATNTGQFGLNLKDNLTPNVGAEVSGTGVAAATTNYSTANQYRFGTGEPVASAAGATNANTFTVSYIVNVPGNQPAGVYATALTYIATATY
jgi:hypothetical protein